ncbi:transposase-like protein [Nocardioides massiliensis]|uniref:Transposase-like protein n=1 Tax=Nocardioides massiliensis TaxID=1325935 RepID=A0ABT9NK73_9ACTN|nr:transposase-like protein [Nocardioides massiliensis]
MTEKPSKLAARRAARAEGPARAAAAELAASGALDGLFAKIDAGEIDLTGDGGFIPELIKTTLERGLQVELADHLGYEKGAPDASAFSNSRNGTTPKTVATQVGDVDLAIPRDRECTFVPRLVPKGSRRLGGLDEMIISLYAGGMTVRDIGYHLEATLGTELSHETISNITDEVAEEILTWQQRPLDALYPVIYLDAIVVKVRDGAHVINKAAHIAVGVDIDGIKHVLGIWLQQTEGAKFWAGVCADLANRGIRDVLIVCCDGLTGLPEAIEATWTNATVQTCVVHLIRAAMRFVGYGDRKAVAAALKPVYTRSQRRGRQDPAGRLRRLKLGQEVSPRGRDVGGRLGAVHTVPGLPAPAASGHLHHQLDREPELPAQEGHQEPRTLPQRRRGREAAVVGDLQNRGQKGPRPRQGEGQARRRTESRRTPRPGPGRDELEASARAARDRLSRAHQPLPVTITRK